MPRSDSCSLSAGSSRSATLRAPQPRSFLRLVALLAALDLGIWGYVAHSVSSASVSPGPPSPPGRALSVAFGSAAGP